MAYMRVTEEERTLIYRWRQEGRGASEIARRLERAANSICREFVRNMGLQQPLSAEGYFRRLVFSVDIRWGGHRLEFQSGIMPAKCV